MSYLEQLGHRNTRVTATLKHRALSRPYLQYRGKISNSTSLWNDPTNVSLYEIRDKIKPLCLPVKFYVSVHWDLITALGQVQHTGVLSKVSVKIALGEHQLMWDLTDTRGMVVPEGSGFSAAWLRLPTWQAHLPSGYGQLAQTMING